MILAVSLILGLFSREHSWLEYAAALTFVMMWAVAGVWLFGRYRQLVNRARQRGSRGPFLPVLVGALLTIGVLCCPLIVEVLGPPHRLLEWFTMAVVAPLWILGCCGWSDMLATGMILLVPRRPQRPGGSRRARFPWRVFAILAFLIGTVLSIALVVWHWRPYHFGGLVFAPDTDRPAILLVWSALQLWAFCVILALVAWSFGRRAHARTYERARADDPRPPVLYLRSFSEESTVFVTFPARGFIDKLVDAVEAIARIENTVPDEKRRPTFEQFFGPAFDARIGALVALGNPAEYLPPLGAAREYVPDERWKEDVQRLAETACCIVASAGQTTNLQWEIARVRQSGLHRKLFFFMPPRSGDDNWMGLANLLRSTGYSVQCGDPGPGAVVGFDEEGTTEIVKHGARAAEDYVQAVADRLADLSGRPENLEPDK